MHILHVHIRVKADCVDRFTAEMRTAAEATRKEPGVVQYDAFQDREDPTRFVIVEAYVDAEAHGRHRETPHFQHWRTAVADMMAEPRRAFKYQAI